MGYGYDGGGPQNKNLSWDRFWASMFEMELPLAEMAITLGDIGILGLFQRKKIRNSMLDMLSSRFY